MLPYPISYCFFILRESHKVTGSNYFIRENHKGTGSDYFFRQNHKVTGSDDPSGFIIIYILSEVIYFF